MSDPKIEPWMVAAAERLTEAEALSALASYRREVSIGLIADIIARHAPDPASVPIGPGDVVQVVEIVPAYASGWHSAFEIGDTLFVSMNLFDAGDLIIVDSVVGNGVICEGHTESPIPIDVLTRIGRAVYWPDGTMVEGGGE